MPVYSHSPASTPTLRRRLADLFLRCAALALLAALGAALLPVRAGAQNPGCTCSITYQGTGNCCYDITFDAMGLTCGSAVIPSLSFNSAFGPNASNILSLSGEPGVVASHTATLGSLSVTGSFTNYGTLPAKIGTICLGGGAAISLVAAEARDAGGALVCVSYDELQGDCAAPPPPGPPSTFDKLYGGSDDDVPEDVLVTSRGDFAVIGNTSAASGDYGTVTLLDAASGSVLWEYRLPGGEYVSDLAEEEATGDLYVVTFGNQVAPGGGWLNNASSLLKLTATGTLAWERRFDWSGRDRMRQVYVNPNATGTGTGVFVLGHRNPTATPSGVDEPLVYLFDTGGNVAWSRVIPEADLEAYRGIVDVGFQSHVILGNDAQGRGVAYEIQSGGFGGVRRRFDATLDLYHGAQLPSGDYLWVGQDFVQNQAVALVTDQSLTVRVSYRVPELDRFEQVFASSGRYYTVGRLRNDPASRNVIVGLTEPAPATLAIDLARRIDDGTGARTLGKLHVLANHPSFIGFAEGLAPTAGFGGTDMHLAIYDRPVSGTCVSAETLTLARFSLPTVSLNTQTQTLPDTAVAPALALQNLNYQCGQACATPPPSCAADFTWVDRGCGFVAFTATPQGLAPFTYAWELTGGGTTQSAAANPGWDYGVGGASVQVCLTITDAAGCSDRVCKPVTAAADVTPPTLTCHPDTTLTGGSLCAGGIFFGHDAGSAVDDCDTIVAIVNTQTPNNFYPCGTTTVTVTATDDAGNVSTCTYDITVECPCAETVRTVLECTDTVGRYRFELTLADLTGGVSCSVDAVRVNPGSVSASAVQWVFDPTTGTYGIRGALDATPGTPFPPSVTFEVDLRCVCPDGTVVTCTQRITVQSPCCLRARLPDTAICADATQITLDVDYFGAPNQVVQVNYWVAPGPCTPGSLPSGQPYQVSRPYRPLLIVPSLMPSNQLCVYAEVYLGPRDAPCTVLRTNVAQLDLCTGFGVSLPSEAFCLATGDQVQPSLLTLNLPPAGAVCPYTDIRWYKDGVPVPSATGSLSLQPNTYTQALPRTQCSDVVTYTAEVDGPCGTETATATVSISNADAPVGALALDPTQPLPLCPGDDATVALADSCLSDPTWTWETRTNTTGYLPVAGAGTRNKLWNTNRLYETTWYRISGSNGACPPVDLELEVPVKPPLTLVNFNVKDLGVCRDGGARISVNFGPCPSGVCDCAVRVSYYRNDHLIHTALSTTGADFYDYTPPAGVEPCGNFHVVLESTCCDQRLKTPVETFGCPIDLVAAGNCVCCSNGEPLLVQGFPVNVDPVAAGCTFQWYLWDGAAWQPILGATSAAHVPSGAGRFRLEMDCGGCMRAVEHEIRNCGCGPASPTRELAAAAPPTLSVAPNPARERVSATWTPHGGAASPLRLELRDARGRLVRSYAGAGRTTWELDLAGVPAGGYLLTAVGADFSITTVRVLVADGQ